MKAPAMKHLKTISIFACLLVTVDVVEPRLSWELRATDENARGLRHQLFSRAGSK